MIDFYITAMFTIVDVAIVEGKGFKPPTTPIYLLNSKAEVLCVYNNGEYLVYLGLEPLVGICNGEHSIQSNEWEAHMVYSYLAEAGRSSGG